MDKKHLVIGIEGEVSSGKTSICKELTSSIPNTIFIDGGTLARSIVHAIKHCKKTPKNIFRIIILLYRLVFKLKIDSKTLMDRFGVSFKVNEDKKCLDIYINNELINFEEIQSASNSTGVSKYTSKMDNSQIFEMARELIRKYNKNYNIVLSGRGLVDIYPDMDFHFYITCDIKERVNRRYLQYNKKYSKEEIKEMILSRDKMHEEAGYNKKCSVTKVVDVTDCKSPKDGVQLLLKVINDKK